MNFKYKNLPVSANVLDAEEGIVEAYVAGIGNKDHGDDIIEPGSFDKYLKIRTPKGVWAHDWNRPVSKTLDIYEVPAGDPRLPQKMLDAGIGGLYVKTQFNLNTKDGRDAFENVKFFDDQSEWSVGIVTHKQKFDKKAHANRLQEIELFEYSPVLFGMNPLTSTASVKAFKQADGSYDFEYEGFDDLGKKAVEAALKVILSSENETASTADDLGEQMYEMIENDNTFLLVETDSGKVKEIYTDRDKAEKALEALNEVKEADLELEELSLDEETDLVEEKEEKTPVEEKSLEEETDKKYMVGSLEERQEELREALREAVITDPESQYLWIRATFDTYVLFDFYDCNEVDDDMVFQVSYMIDDTGAYVFGTPVEVEIVEVVMMEEMEKQIASGTLHEKVAEKIKSLAASLEDTNEVKAGATLSAANREKLAQAFDALQSVLGIEILEPQEEKEIEAPVEEKDLEIDVEVKVTESDEKSEEEDIVEKTDETSGGGEIEETVEEIETKSVIDGEMLKALANFDSLLLDLEEVL